MVIDDGSTDMTGDVCGRLQAEDSRVRYFRKENAGVSDARNLGMEKAKGEYIFFLDADDYIPGYALETLVGEMEKGGAGAVFGTHAYDYSGKILPRVPRVSGGSYTYKELAAYLLDDGTLSGMLFGSVGGYCTGRKLSRAAVYHSTP